MKSSSILTAVCTLFLFATVASSQSGSRAFSFPDTPVGKITLSGRGFYDAPSSFVHAGGSFVVTEDITSGPLAGLRAGEGVRWRATQLLIDSGFKCGGSATEPLKTAVTGDDTVVMQVEFHRAGIGADESLTAKVFVSRLDLDPDQPGVQNVWIQAVGCGEASVEYR